MKSIDQARTSYLDNALSQVWNIASTMEKALSPDQEEIPIPDFIELAKKIGSEASVDSNIRRCTLPMLESLCGTCHRCPLSETRTNVVFGCGSTTPLVMVVGEGPGYHEDQQGLPFVGQAGQFLDKWLASINLSRDSNTYICNIIKCRPPENRDPLENEIAACHDYLTQQVALLKPRAILGLGKFASQFLLASDKPMGELHGIFHIYRGIPTICTYHPAAVLRNLGLKRPVWEDLKKLAKFLGIGIG